MHPRLARSVPALIPAALEAISQQGSIHTGGDISERSVNQRFIFYTATT